MNKRRAIFQVTLIVLACALCLEGCTPRGDRFPGANVILISVDTLRSDHLPAYGYAGVETPTIDALVADSVLFERAFCHSPLTLPSHATIMTGLLPAEHGVRENLGFKLNADHETLAEAFKARGYDTSAFVSSMVLRRSTGIAQGFDRYDDELDSKSDKNVANYAQREGKIALDRAAEWLSAHAGRPFFVWIHLYEPHTPYAPPEPFALRFEHPYDGEIAYSDALLGDFFEFLKTRDLYRNALIVLCSDHGEGLGEHGEEEHGIFVYRTTIQVPLIFKLPGNVRGNSRREDLASLIDVFPTVLDVVGEGGPSRPGVDLFSGRKGDAERMVFSESLTPQLHYGWHPQHCIVQGNAHYIEGYDEETYDLVSDPAELNDLFPRDGFPAAIEEALDALERGIEETTDVSAEDQAMLSSLGYLGGADLGSAVLQLAPREFMQVYETIDDAVDFINQGAFDRAEKILEPLYRSFPSIIEVHVLLGTALSHQGKIDRAESVYIEGLGQQPNHMSLLQGLALIKAEKGEFEQAAQLGLKAAPSAPIVVSQSLIPDLLKSGQFDAVQQMARLALDENPDFGLGHFALGRVANAHHAFEDAVDHLKQATELCRQADQRDLLLSSLLFWGDALARSEQYEQTLQVFRQGLAIEPNHANIRRAMSMTLASMQRPREAIAVLDEWVHDFPSKKNYLTAAETMATIGLKEPAAFYRQEAAKYSSP